MQKKNLLELFAGSRCIGRAAHIGGGYNVFSVDWEAYDAIDLVVDIEEMTPGQVPFIPDIVWASFDCTTYSIAGISHHRDGVKPKSEYAEKSDRVNKNAIKIIKHFLAINPDMKFYIENPRGMLRKMPFMQEFDRVTVWYCRYGDRRAKPTDIWTNNLRALYNPTGNWTPRPECYNGNVRCGHELAPRGSKAGTQGIAGSYERSKIPNELCIEILQSVITSRCKGEPNQ